MGSVLKADCSAGDSYVAKLLGSPAQPWYIEYRVAIPSSTYTALDGVATGFAATNLEIGNHPLTFGDGADAATNSTFGSAPQWYTNHATGALAGTFTPDTWHTVKVSKVSNILTWNIDGTDLFTYNLATLALGQILVGGWASNSASGEIYYVDDVKVGTTLGGTDIFSDDFESGTLAAWDSTTGSVSVVADPGFAGIGAGTSGRVLIAFDDGPLVAAPAWTRIDDTPNLVAAIDITTGRQTLISQTDTGTATVYLNDTTGLFDPRNGLSPYFGKFDGRQILIQLYNPVTATWEPQFRGLIDDYGYIIDPASDKDGNPIVANIQIDCVDIFDYLAGYGLTPGLDGVTAPAGSEGTVYYAATAGTVDGRITEVLTDAGLDSSMYVVFTGNVSLQESKYDADESALVVLRDCADAEIPFIANIYVDRHGRFCFHGRESRFTPDSVAAGAGTAAWDFQRWKVGDGAAVKADSTRAQIRVLEYSRARSNIINAAMCYPKGIAETDIPSQVYADSTSITDYGKHTPPGGPITDLQINVGTTTGNAGPVECQKYAELLVKNQKDPREAITALQLKCVSPSDVRATTVWKMLTRADISDIVNVKAGYGGGTGMTGAATQDDYYIEGRTMRIEPATAIESGGFDYVELNLDLSPAVWSMDTHSVF